MKRWADGTDWCYFSVQTVDKALTVIKFRMLANLLCFSVHSKRLEVYSQ